jgi:tRNA(Ile)-lysidine synthase TilS/MesJ
MAFAITTCMMQGCNDTNSRRQRVKQLISQMALEHPHLRQKMLRALSNVCVKHLLDRELLQKVNAES